MSIPIQTNQTLLSLQGLFGSQSRPSGSASQNSSFNQLVAALEQGGSGAPATTSGTQSPSGPQNLLQSLSQGLGAAPASSPGKNTGVSGAQDGTAQASGHHHGHHHGGGSSWLTDLLDDNGSATATTASASNNAGASASAAGSAAYAWQQLAQTAREPSAFAARSLLAVG